MGSSRTRAAQVGICSPEGAEMWCQVCQEKACSVLGSAAHVKTVGMDTKRGLGSWQGDAMAFCHSRRGTSTQEATMELVGIRSHMGQGDNARRDVEERPSVGHPGLGLDVEPHQASPFPQHPPSQGCVWC